MIIKVTQHDIDNGRRDDPVDCPVGLACARAGLRDPLIGSANMWHGMGSSRRTTLPLNARKFLDDFDNVRTVAPFAFELDVDLTGWTHATDTGLEMVWHEAVGPNAVWKETPLGTITTEAEVDEGGAITEIIVTDVRHD